MKTEFFKPRFTGPRFEEHTLPIEVAADLAAYKDLVVELAKHLYLRDHQTRERVPKGFEQSFSLHLEAVEPGSTTPVLALVAAAGLALQGGAGDYFTQARDLVTECVKAKTVGQALPVQFPKQLLAYFNVFGRSLREGEALELPAAGGDAAVLTPERRKALVLDAQKVYLKEVDVAGMVAEVDFDRETFRLRRDDGTSVVAPLPAVFVEDIRAAGGKERTLVQVKGIGIFDAWEKLQKLAETQHLESQPNYALASQIEALAVLENGWLDGNGVAPDKEQLAWASGLLAKNFPETLAFPIVGPTPEGGLFLEWVTQHWRVSAEILLPGHTCELQAVNLESGDVLNQTTNLDDAQGLTGFYKFIRQFV